ncbi:MAG: 16S rRNA (cytosine(1402)-N(4))-methyltransferase RsmH [Chitinispirillales bacterium]|jgi:16S rRNA (cytosine1402-N4)-methyltransferase|nr:16S rRNA (cytosine(1402)-N(4))-methyltransferase RsmH [Chitinispirillales bacterium]
MSETEYHVPVLLGEVLELLVGGGDMAQPSIKDSRKVYVDGTLGGGGHFRAVAGALSGRDGAGECVVIGIDRDREALDNVRRGGLGGTGAKVILEQSRFSEFDSVLRKHGIDRVAGLLVDLGVSSRQIDAPGRGFMYMRDAPLDMRMDQGGGLTAAEFLEHSDEGELALVFEKYGEIRNARRMAGVIKDYMRQKKILTSADLKDCLTREYGANLKIQVFAKLFQALRIAVNGELEELRLFLDKSVRWLAEGGRIAVISYHSLEDRMVKEFFRAAEGACVCDPGLPVCNCNRPVLLKRVNRKAVTASDEEITLNPRSRSARLRVAERTKEACL